MHLELLKPFARDGGLTLRVNGDCMSGVFSDGAKIRVERRVAYLPGDVLVFARGDGELISHRLLGFLPGRKGWRVLTRGDNYQQADPPTALSRVLGRITQINGKALHCGISTRVRSGLAYFPGVAGWLKLRLTKQDKNESGVKP
jgi:hypothetical protein